VKQILQEYSCSYFRLHLRKLETPKLGLIIRDAVLRENGWGSFIAEIEDSLGVQNFNPSARTILFQKKFSSDVCASDNFFLLVDELRHRRRPMSHSYNEVLAAPSSEYFGPGSLTPVSLMCSDCAQISFHLVLKSGWSTPALLHNLLSYPSRDCQPSKQDYFLSCSRHLKVTYSRDDQS
jgi:hypothetical protein